MKSGVYHSNVPVAQTVAKGLVWIDQEGAMQIEEYCYRH